MKRFVVPPNWPAAPSSTWVPPKRWGPDPDWPPPPPDWCFWVNARGKPVIGPLGQYGAPSAQAAYLGVGAAVAFICINLWAANTLGLVNGTTQGDHPPVALVQESATPTPHSSVTTPVPTTPRSRPTPTLIISRPPARTSHPTPSVRREQRPAQPTKTASPAPTASPSTQPGDVYAQQCQRFGIDPKWCGPSGGFTSQDTRHR